MLECRRPFQSVKEFQLGLIAHRADGDFNLYEALVVLGFNIPDPASEDGQILGAVLPKPNLSVSPWFADPGGDGISADVLDAAGVSGAVAGLLQIKVRVPPSVTAGDSVPFSLQIGSESAEFATVALR